MKKPYSIDECILKDGVSVRCDDCSKIITERCIKVCMDRKDPGKYFCADCFRFYKKNYEAEVRK
jgi:hypothetical protein